MSPSIRLNHLILHVLTTWAVTSFAHARIGETLDECKARYGEPFYVAESNQYMFGKSGLTICINFLKGKAGNIIFSKMPERLTEAEVTSLLGANAIDGAWIKSDVNGCAVWDSANGKLFASYTEHNGVLAIMTIAWREASDVEKNLKDQGLEGF